MPQNIRTDTPDLAFVNALCAGKADEVAALFREKKLFWDEGPAVDAPYGRCEGLDGIRSFAKGFLTKFKATSATFTPVFQTIGGGRIALEGVFKFVVDGAIEEVPFFVDQDGSVSRRGLFHQSGGRVPRWLRHERAGRIIYGKKIHDEDNH